MTSVSERVVSIDEESGGHFLWMSEETMVATLGEKKAEMKIQHGNLDTRPDQDTGRTDRYSLEYKVWTTKGNRLNKTSTAHRLSTEEEVLEDQKAEKIEDFEAAAKMVNISNGDDPVPIKIEPGVSSEAGASQVLTDTDPHKKTVDGIMKNPKAVLRATQDTIINLKKTFEQTSKNKYTEALNADVGKVLPKFVQSLKSLERVCSSEVAAEEKDATIYAIAAKLDSNYETYDVLMDWAKKIVPNKKKKVSS